MTIVSDIKAALGAMDDEPVGPPEAVRLWRREEVPESAAFPYVSIFDVSAAPALSGDARAMAFGELLQLDLWQETPVGEPRLHERVVDALDGIRADGRKLSVLSVTRVTETASGTDVDEDEVLHHAITLARPRVR